MRNFRCCCGNLVFFENTRCIVCGRHLGFIAETCNLAAFEPGEGTLLRACLPDGGLFRPCANAGEGAQCNWMIAAADPEPWCRSCRLNQIIPDLSRTENRLYWRRIENAKRRLVYSLLQLRLPLIDRRQNPESGLAFQFLADETDASEFSDRLDTAARVLTGHMNGLITINVAEADDVERERMRKLMKENYRTLLGHFRHEVAHYYWPILIRGGGRLAAFRELFGDERQDYAAALDRYYSQGASADWQAQYVSAYASAHPWEDWAESFAHYLHITDTLEAAADAGILPALAGQRTLPSAIGPLLERWRELIIALNSLNRCMGLPDAYPFVLSGRADEKIVFVHDSVAAVAGRVTPTRSAAGA